MMFIELLSMQLAHSYLIVTLVSWDDEESSSSLHSAT